MPIKACEQEPNALAQEAPRQWTWRSATPPSQWAEGLSLPEQRECLQGVSTLMLGALDSHRTRSEGGGTAARKGSEAATKESVGRSLQFSRTAQSKIASGQGAQRSFSNMPFAFRKKTGSTSVLLSKETWALTRECLHLETCTPLLVLSGFLILFCWTCVVFAAAQINSLPLAEYEVEQALCCSLG